MEKRDGIQKVGRQRPTFTPELGRRIDALYQAAGGPGSAAALVGYTTEQLRRWKIGEARLPFNAAVILCERACKSLDWLATGKEPPGEDAPPVDEGLLRDVIEAVDEHLAENGLALKSAKKALLITQLYMIMMEEKEEVATSGDLISRFIRVAT